MAQKVTGTTPSIAKGVGRLRMSRRRFIGLTAGLMAAGGGTYWFSRSPIRIALIGAGTQGTRLAEYVNRSWWYGQVYGKLVAVCDVDSQRGLAAKEELCSEGDLYGDYRQVLSREDIEAVVVATPDHWHITIAIEALRAGKHLYLEKPISLTVDEGKLLVAEAAKHDRVVLVGTQQRTDSRFRTACELVRNGRVGHLHSVTVTLPQRWQGDSPGPFPGSAPPPHLDWDAWLGQAPSVPFAAERCHGFFRRWYEYAGGQMTDWGAHHLDIVQWGLGMDQSGPETIEGQAEMPNVPGGYNTPIEFTVDLRYPGDIHVRVQTNPDYESNGILFEGDQGSVFVNRARLTGSAVDNLEEYPLPSDAIRLHETSPASRSVYMHHLLHFFRCIRGNEQPVSDVVSQHRSASVCHLANIAMRLGRRLRWDAEQEQILDDTEANGLLGRPQRTPYQLPV